ncbi:hypothetical protein [Mycolicibacterium komossense]|uniref:Uncharacterized protein n=1 Tax=Mycolicibacterium komossense TaxID=1779 RepID=A0ABT3CKD9_9MYCO|nr:hypothetical protein [Mycolicibacterium komossense]MCV7229988.1 hypothetical protein [Mycolicibacterium komossense]
MTTTFPRGSMPNFDISPSGPLRIGVDHAPNGAIRIRATDLRGVTQRAAAVRADHPDAVVVVDIEAMIARDAQSARSALAQAGWDRGDTLLYVGTPAGLAGLIADIHALAIADGAVLLPVTDAARVLIFDEVLPELSTMGPISSLTREPRPA